MCAVSARQQRDRQRHVDVEPEVEARLERHRAARPRDELLLAHHQRVELLVDARGLVAAQRLADRLRGPSTAAVVGHSRVASGELRAPRAADPRSLRRRQ